MTRIEFISEISKGRKIFPKEDFSGQDLSGLDLHGFDLRRCNFTNANLSNCNLTNVIMVVANLQGANLSGAILDGCDFELVSNADTANFIDATYKGQAIKSAPIVDKVGKYQRLVTDQFIQIGCMQGDGNYWKTMDEDKLRAEVDKINPAEKDDAVAWKNAHLAKTVKDHEDKKPKP